MNPTDQIWRDLNRNYRRMFSEKIEVECDECSKDRPGIIYYVNRDGSISPRKCDCNNGYRLVEVERDEE